MPSQTLPGDESSPVNTLPDTTSTRHHDPHSAISTAPLTGIEQLSGLGQSDPNECAIPGASGPSNMFES